MRKMFSEKQIKNIVNQGIESGEISGGTKLYLHTLYFESSGFTIYIVSSIEDVAQSGTDIDSLIEHATSPVFRTANAASFMFGDTENSMFYFITSSDNALVIDNNVDYYDNEFTDTVTPL